MPIEIKELHIKINVSDNANSTAATSTTSSAKKEKLIEACIEQVMRIQERKNKR